MVRSGEVELQLQGLLDERVTVKLRSVVCGDGSELIGMAPGNAKRSSIELLHRSSLELADEHVSSLALHQAHDAVLAAFADHGVDFPVADPAAALHAGRPLRDMSLAGQFATAVMGAIALAAILAGPAKMHVQPAPTSFIVPDMPVDGLMTDAQQALVAQMPRYLLRAPLLAQQRVNLVQILEREALVAARARAPAIGALNSRAGTVVPVKACAVTLEFAADGAAVAPQLPGDLRLVEALRSERGEHIPLS